MLISKWHRRIWNSRKTQVCNYCYNIAVVEDLTAVLFSPLFLPQIKMRSHKVAHIVGLTRICRFSPRIQQFSSRFRRELLNSLRESSNSRRMFSNSRRRIRRELLILQKITTNREKRKVNLVATENWTILCCDENSYSRWDENWPILCCEENSNSRRDEICPILCCEENSNSVIKQSSNIFRVQPFLWKLCWWWHRQ